MMSKVFLETISTYVVSFATGIMIGIAIYELSHKKKEPTGGTGYDDISKACSQILQDSPIPMEHEHDN